MTDLQCSGTVFVNLAWYQRTKDLVPLFDPKVNLFENSLLKILAQLSREEGRGVQKMYLLTLLNIIVYFNLPVYICTCI